jgi:hypothetical protein
MVVDDIAAGDVVAGDIAAAGAAKPLSLSGIPCIRRCSHTLSGKK